MSSPAPEPVVEVTRYRVRGLPEGHSGRQLADVVVALSVRGWRVGGEGEWVGPGGARIAEPVEMDLDTALAAARAEATTLAAAVREAHPR